MVNTSPFETHYRHGRPMITAKLQKGNLSAKYFEFLIDTGADFTLMSQYDASLFGVQYDDINSVEIKIEAANQTLLHAKKAKVNIILGTHSLLVPILISREQVEIPLLGRKGIFDQFKITFEEREGVVVFERNE